MSWVADTGPLVHFAKAGWLGVLKMLAPSHRIMIPDVVEQELKNHVSQYSYLQSVLDAEWITIVTLEPRDLNAFGLYTQRLVGTDGRNMGECGVLALAENRSWVAILDDNEASKAAKEIPATPIEVRRTLSLLCDAINDGHLTRELVSALCDDLADSKYRVPFKPGGFIQWAEENGRIQQSPS
ncbi:hypothetical protein HMPREF1531_01576 [Propionibacterium sp. oral taxon 192 str. F0372]|uniref:hypothetical protein n=1 Tax=Propionibacterium sp. oral taxon 192 TaxID=671222 RepID=UPI0003537DD4|nr:hypothetical protein [Propionibacterium sp. oral taxon 192]EPH02270.1 hypothetical protein HMPREF1531_01576 [Propionibacterium sp. oral taxon 192 str. F0372]